MNKAGPPLSVVGVITGLLLVAGCSSGGALSPPGANSAGVDSRAASSGSPVEGSTLQSALGRFDSSLANIGLYASFGDTAALAVLAAKEPQTWQPLALNGATEAFSTGADQAATIGADLTAAEYSISVAQPPGRLTLVTGGQDAGSITAAAEKSGYIGEVVLFQNLNPANPLTITVTQIEPKGEDLVVGGPDADLKSVDPDGESLMDLDEVAAIVECLGDVVIAQIAPNSEDIDLVGVGVRSADGGVESVMCVKPKSAGEVETIATEVAEALKNGKTTDGLPYTKYFESVDVVAADGVVKMTAHNTADGPTHAILGMVSSRDLPGLPGY